MKIKVFADGANLEEIVRVYKQGGAQGFTTNPTLMAKAGIKDYEGFAKQVLSQVRDLPISFEVFSDEFPEMERQAQKIKSWGTNVNVKIPICNTQGQSSVPLIQSLLKQGVKLNVTAIFTEAQLQGVREVMSPNDDVILSIFAGRIADTGVDPMPLMKRAVAMFTDFPKAQILWASPREALNIYQADECGCHIITATPDLLAKLSQKGKSLEKFSIETVAMFYNDAQNAGFQL